MPCSATTAASTWRWSATALRRVASCSAKVWCETRRVTAMNGTS